MTVEVGFIEPFDQYAVIESAQAGLCSVWTLNSYFGEPSNLTFGVGFSGAGQCLKIPFLLFGGTLTRGFPSTQFLSQAFSFRIDSTHGTAEQALFSILDDTGAVQFTIGFNSIGNMTLRGEGNALLWTSEKMFNVGVVYRCNMTVDSSDDNATVINLWETGNQLLEDEVLDLQDSASQQMAGVRLFFPPDLGGTLGQWSFSHDDMVVLYGDEVVNLGETGVILLGPTADVQSDWTPSAGADNYPNVDDVPHNRDVDYNSSEIVGNRDLFTMANLTRNPDKIHYVSQLSVARKEESGTRAIKNVLKSAAVTQLGAEYHLSQTYTYDFDHYPLNPDGNVEWTKAAVDALQSGYDDAI